ncbi:MAG: hypothetical protein M1823_000314 [Watsoniomyces obsoletus]|nr:MAG: hypothetical protein M1823_000314 [Watsoniomyces obsoletus]
MPVHPSEEETQTSTGSITEQVAKNPSSNTASTASDHPIHQGDQSGGKSNPSTQAKAEHFQSQPGPVLPQDVSAFEQPASKEELRAKAEELNK